MSDSNSTLLSFGEFELDTVLGELRKAGERIQLKSQQVRLLVLLATRAGEVVSRDEIRHALWDGETFVEFDQSINVAVNKIRNALGDDPHRSRFIETLPRKGYRFIAPVAPIEAQPKGQDRFTTATSLRTRWFWLATAGALAVLTVLAVMARRTPPSTPAPLGAARFVITTPSEHPLNLWGPLRDVTLSPDGRTVVYRAGGSQTAGSLLAIRSLNRLDVRQVEGAEWVYAPFFSPDGRWIAFFSNSELKKVPVSGGRAVSVCEFGGTPLGATWDEDNSIIFGTGGPNAGLWRVSANGGKVVRLASPETIDQKTFEYAYPSPLPHGRGVVFTVHQTNEAGGRDVAVLDFRTGEMKTLIAGASDAQYVDAGYLLFVGGTSLQGVRFDAERLEIIGDPVTLGEDVLVKPSGLGDYAVSRDGTLVFAAAASARPSLRSLVWVDREGREEPLGVPPRQYGPPRISPDGRRVAVGIEDRGDADVWLFDLEGAALKRLTFAPGSNGMPLWTPDAQRLIFSSRNANGVLNLYSQEADGTGSPEALTSNPIPRWPSSVASNGKWVLGFDLKPQRPPDVIAIALDHPGGLDAAGAHLESPAEESLFQGSFPEISPDGRFVAYQSNESGQSQVYLRPFPKVQGGAWQISTTGGTRPAWGRDGRELFFLDRANAMMVVPVQMSGATVVLGTPMKLFDNAYLEPNPARHYDVSPDSKRFLMMKEATGGPRAPISGIVVVINWLDDLNQPAAR